MYKIYKASIYGAEKVSTTSILKYILYVLRLRAKVLLSSKPILAKLGTLLKVLL